MYWSIRHVLEIEKYTVRFFSLKSFSFALLYNKLPFILNFFHFCMYRLYGGLVQTLTDFVC